MATDERVRVLEGEFKLIKSELRQTLIGVRDFLLDLKLPASQEEINSPEQNNQPERPIPESIPDTAAPESAPAAENPPERVSAFDNLRSPGYSEPMAPMMASPMPQTVQYTPVEARPTEDSVFSAEPETPLDIDTDVAELSSGDIPSNEPDTFVESPPEKGSLRTDAAAPAEPQVNILANLIRWVAMARKDIGKERLPVFLDIYATSGNLTPEMKEVILHLAEVTSDPDNASEPAGKTGEISEQMEICLEINRVAGQLPEEVKVMVRRLTELILRQTAYSNKADIWSRMLLELHGILNGAGAPLQPASVLNSRVKEVDTLTEVEEIQPQPVQEPSEENSMEEDPSLDVEDESEEEPVVGRGLKPARLRLVLPLDDNNEQELDLGSLFISTESPQRKGNGHKDQPVVEGKP